MTPAEQLRAQKAAYACRWRAKHRSHTRAYKTRWQAQQRHRERVASLRELESVPSLTLAQVCRWLKLKALIHSASTEL